MKHLIALSALLFVQSSQADFSILALGDQGKANETQFAVSRAMKSECDRIDCQFVFLLGDNVYEVGITSPNDPLMIENFEKPYEELQVPFYVALGNHDYGKLANDWKRGEYQVEYSKINPKWKLPAPYYSFEKDNALFIVLDTSRLFWDFETDQQFRFVREALARNTRKWVVVISHHPYISNGKHGNAGSYDGVPLPPFSGSIIKKMIEKELCGKAQLFLSGHDHSMQTLPGTEACPNSLFVVSGVGASASDKIKNNNPILFHKATPGFLRLHFTDSKIEVSHVNMQGETEHTTQIQQ